MKHENNPEKIIIIGGTTCTGKTEVSAELSRYFPAEIINFDSMCFYRHFDIGTAKPGAEIISRIRHHLIDIKDPNEGYNAHSFSQDAAKIVSGLAATGKIPVFVGGTGLYMRAFLYGLSPIPEINTDFYRDKVSNMIMETGIENVYLKLTEADPDYAQKISGSDRQRISRAYEVYLATGKPFSLFHKENPFTKPRYDFAYFNLISTKDELKSCIIKRTRAMIKNGLVDEIKKILKMGYSQDVKAFKGIGYKEGLLYLKGAIKTEEELFSSIVASTMKYAKRQATFLKKEKNITEVTQTDFNGRIEFLKVAIGDFLGR